MNMSWKKRLLITSICLLSLVGCDKETPKDKPSSSHHTVEKKSSDKQAVVTAKKSVQIMKNRVKYFNGLTPYIQKINNDTIYFVEAIVLFASEDLSYEDARGRVSKYVSDFGYELKKIQEKGKSLPPDQEIKKYHQKLVSSLESLHATMLKGNRAMGVSINGVDEQLLKEVAQELKVNHQNLTNLNKEGERILKGL
ncbi:hypothetical protein JK635_08015 [Neobacillus sp. YIM B02564]|uniref:Lipoprotein n=1 Tax=Neobacillus paridis TaxID=2803862 RepID=A0ABS1TLG1_9BACI|nr:hypothetical protein [Neobacillus paridis]MBL4952156.1 hypothetical protein [Neobacillus paridis]